MADDVDRIPTIEEIMTEYEVSRFHAERFRNSLLGIPEDAIIDLGEDDDGEEKPGE